MSYRSNFVTNDVVARGDRDRGADREHNEAGEQEIIKADETLAARIAKRMVRNVADCSNRNIHFFVVDDRVPPPFPTQWRYKNTSGVTFARKATAEAEAWVRTALLAGYSVFCKARRDSWGAGRGLKHGGCSEDR